MHDFNGVLLADGFTAVVLTDRRFLTRTSLCCSLQLHFHTATVCMQAERRPGGSSDAESLRQNTKETKKAESQKPTGAVIMLTDMLTTQRDHLSDMAF